MDGPPALALGLEPVRDYVLNRKPLKRDSGIIARSMIVNIVMNATIIIGLIYMQSRYNILNATEIEQGTVVFSVFAFSVLFNALNCREFGIRSAIPNFFKNKLALEVIAITGVLQVLFTQVFNKFFNSVPLNAFMWIKILLLSSSILIINEVVKYLLRLIRKAM